jgi:hypothetical protein
VGNFTEQQVADLRQLAEDRYAIAHAHVAIEDVAVENRDSRISFPFRGNGISIREKDGSPSSALRIPTDDAVRIALKALADYVGGKRDLRIPEPEES